MKNPGQIINLVIQVPISLAGRRLDQAVAELFPQYSRARLQEWIRTEQLLVDGQSKRPRDAVHGGEHIVLNAYLPEHTNSQWHAQAIALNIIYEDEALLVINKPVGLVVHPAAGNMDKTLVNALLHHYPQLSQLPRAGIVHRLDKDTSGLLVVAKTLSAHHDLTKQLQKRSVKREYEAIVTGVLISGSTIDAPLDRHPVNRKKRAVIETGKPAVTHYRVLERLGAFTRVKAKLETGRTHQIRVHFAYIHHPLVGDQVYSRLQIPKGATEEVIAALRKFKRQALHAERLGLVHPDTGEFMEWQVPIPDDMQALLEVLRKND